MGAALCGWPQLQIAPVALQLIVCSIGLLLYGVVPRLLQPVITEHELAGL